MVVFGIERRRSERAAEALWLAAERRSVRPTRRRGQREFPGLSSPRPRGIGSPRRAASPSLRSPSRRGASSARGAALLRPRGRRSRHWEGRVAPGPHSSPWPPASLAPGFGSGQRWGVEVRLCWGSGWLPPGVGAIGGGRSALPGSRPSAPRRWVRGRSAPGCGGPGSRGSLPGRPNNALQLTRRRPGALEPLPAVGRPVWGPARSEGGPRRPASGRGILGGTAARS